MSVDDDGENTDDNKDKTRRKLGGDLTYNSTPGGLERTLQGIIRAQKPPKVDTSYIQTVLGVKGGTGSAQVGTLKKLGLIDQSSSPTELYDQFRSDRQRSKAAFQMLNNGYQSLFGVSSQIHRAPETEVEDVIAQVTGLDKDDALIRTIYACFDKVRSFINPSDNVYEDEAEEKEKESPAKEKKENEGRLSQEKIGSSQAIGLTYSINIVLPQSGNIDTYNMIFRSLRENILDWQK
ncbi:DUF5343 domain-containing protein [Hyphomonas johnsonii]|uniref:DUF5343 domain-containing protein n=1 Tax=Hyphomonas johnsonii MHS-2 TaxID=1280950 RepID=A0A059FNX3_9PROT|nr:DUF5343 domain-containing protein [Hyphomonas johnsonii]KCZ92317.1 hypothetical protein HJO_09789 [Hyphomonas johnsonii MHS-2]